MFPFFVFFFFNDTATTEIYTLSLHDALPIPGGRHGQPRRRCRETGVGFVLPPRHGHAAAVASLVPAVRVDVQRILATLGRHECLLEAELFALVDEVLTRQAEQQKSRRFGAL